MQNKTPENWKEILLKSGIPLESSIRNILEGMSFDGVLEYNFLRKNDKDIINNFSVDIHACKNIYANKISHKCFTLEYLIECKYCTPDSHWVFMPNANSYSVETPSLYIDHFDSEYCCNSSYLETIFNEYKITGKGFSLRNKNSDNTQIKEAYNQLSYAYIHRYIEKSSWDNYDVYFLIPIIVTTANLWRLKENITIGKIQHANKLEEVCENYNVLRFQSDSDRLMANYFREKYDELDKYTKAKIAQRFHKNYNETIEAFIDAESTFVPNTFLIMNYANFEKEFRKLDQSLSKLSIIEKRNNAK